MVTVSSVLCVVYKRTGGKLWNKPWGLPPLSKTQKRNRLESRRQQQSVVSILKLAAASEPLKPPMSQAGT